MGLLVMSCLNSLFSCRTAACWLLAVAVLVPGRFAQAQKPTPPYQEDKSEITLPAARESEIRRLVDDIYRGKEPLQPNVAKFDGYFNRINFPQFAKKDNLSKLPVLRQQFFVRESSRCSKNAEVHGHLMDLALAKMTEYSKAPYYPATRVNAMLLLGDLNSQERGTTTAPVPLPAAMDVMLDELGSAQQIDAVRVAALVGILRHVELNRFRSADRQIPAVTRERIVDQMLAILGATNLPAGRSREGHYWLQRRAVDVLALFGTAGQNGNVVVAVDKVLADDKAPLMLRCSAAAALGTLPIPPAVRLDTAATAKNLAAVAAEACSRERNRLAKMKGIRSDADNVKDARRQLKYQLGCVFEALGGEAKDHGIVRAGGADPAAVAAIDAVHRPVASVLALVDQQGLRAGRLADAIAAPERQLSALLRTGPAAGPGTPVETTDGPAPDGPTTDGPADRPGGAPAEGPADGPADLPADGPM